jgi:hypothetical protein
MVDNRRVAFSVRRRSLMSRATLCREPLGSRLVLTSTAA